jgi:hypothetical protein
MYGKSAYRLRTGNGAGKLKEGFIGSLPLFERLFGRSSAADSFALVGDVIDHDVIAHLIG